MLIHAHCVGGERCNYSMLAPISGLPKSINIRLNKDIKYLSLSPSGFLKWRGT
jgi:hypothetical protein